MLKSRGLLWVMVTRPGLKLKVLDYSRPGLNSYFYSNHNHLTVIKIRIMVMGPGLELKCYG